MYGWVSSSEVAFAAFLFPGIGLMLYGLRRPQAIGWYAVAGMMIGYSALIRPLGLLALVVAIPYVLYRNVSKPGLITALALVLGACAVIAPWTIRNCRCLHRFVLISTNGGEVFFAANATMDPLLGGAYMPANYQWLRQAVPDEVERSNKGFVWGLRHIITHPGIFARSLPHRYAMLLQQQSWIPGYALKGAGHEHPHLEMALVALSLWGYWLIPALLMVAGLRTPRLIASRRPAALCAVLYIAYWLVVPLFEVFERTNYPYCLMPLVLAVSALSCGDEHDSG